MNLRYVVPYPQCCALPILRMHSRGKPAIRLGPRNSEIQATGSAVMVVNFEGSEAINYWIYGWSCIPWASSAEPQ